MTLWNVVQAVQIRGLSSRAVLSDSEAERHRRSARQRDDELADDLARLRLVTEALWSLCSERLGITEDDLRARVVELDRASGALDGRSASAAPRPCPSCAAMVPADRPTCQFCGAWAPGQSIFVT